MSCVEELLSRLFELRGDVLYRRYKKGWRPAKLSSSSGGYLRVGLPNNKQVTVHRVIWFLTYGNLPDKTWEIDHINCDRKDNRIENLRLVTKTDNQSNRLANKKALSSYKGVYLQGGKYWIASISVNKRRYHIGTFKTELEAAKAYNSFAEQNNLTNRRINNV
jgi:hypothetical protein